MEINERIKSIIEDEDININELSNYIGVNRKQVQRWQAGTAEMGIFKLKEFCKFTGISADYILGLPEGLKRPR